MTKINENAIEELAIECLEALGYTSLLMLGMMGTRMMRITRIFTDSLWQMFYDFCVRLLFE